MSVLFYPFGADVLPEEGETSEGVGTSSMTWTICVRLRLYTSNSRASGAEPLGSDGRTRVHSQLIGDFDAPKYYLQS